MTRSVSGVTIGLACALEFDYAGAKKPIQLNDNLEAFIKVRSTGEILKNYNVLSSGMRNFLFRIGHIFSLFFDREIDRALAAGNVTSLAEGLRERRARE